MRGPALIVMCALLTACAAEEPVGFGPAATTSSAPVSAVSGEGTRHRLDNSEALIPYQDTMIYPENWRDITRRRSDAAP